MFVRKTRSVAPRVTSSTTRQVVDQLVMPSFTGKASFCCKVFVAQIVFAYLACSRSKVNEDTTSDLEKECWMIVVVCTPA